MLSCNGNGLLIVDSFLALSFGDLEECFKTQQIANFAYVFMAQYNAPPFCLGCIGTNNCFTATDVLKRWKYIYSECHKRSITVISFGGDGDYRILSVMKVSCEFKLNANDKQQFNLSPSSLLKEVPNTKQWPWFLVKANRSCDIYQDYVHVAVKLSIILPLGDFLAGSHHF